MAEGPSRRDVLAAGAAAGLSGPAAALSQPPDAVRLAADEGHWRAIAAAYDRPAGIVPLENGQWGVMARPVLQEYLRRQTFVNSQGSYYARRGFGDDFAGVRRRIAEALGVGADEIAITRNATEALQALIGGYNRLAPGDGVLLADLDYDSMQTAMRWLAARRGVEVVEIALPEPATQESLLAAYRDALARHPRIRLILLTHLSHRTGLVLPAAKITALARAQGVDVIVDAAHSWGQLDFTLDALGADFVGLNLHKWIGAPIGAGVMYVRRGRLDAIDPFMGEPDAEGPRTDARVHTGTTNFAAVLTVPAALDWRAQVGAAAIEARLRHLRDAWAEAVRGEPGLEILTPKDPALHAGITSVRLSGKTSVADNRALARRLLDEHTIFTVHRAGPAKGACVRVTPALLNSLADVDRLAGALRAIARR